MLEAIVLRLEIGEGCECQQRSREGPLQKIVVQSYGRQQWQCRNLKREKGIHLVGN